MREVLKIFISPCGWTLLLTLLIAVNVNAVNFTLPSGASLWDTARPGELLHALDLITDETMSRPQQSNDAPLLFKLADTKLAPQSRTIQRRVEDSPESNVYSTEDHLDDLDDDHDAFDYDRTYQNFVREYFDSIANDADDVSASVDENDASVEEQFDVDTDVDEPLLSEARKVNTNVKQRCHSVRKHGEVCKVCRNPKTDEKFETCAYSTESEPIRYAFQKGSRYNLKKGNNDDSANAEQQVHLSITPKNSKKAYSRPKAIKKKKNSRVLPEAEATSNSSCIKKRKGNQSCYYCENSKGEKMVRCMEMDQPSNNQNGHKRQESQQRIYKRKVSYSYKRDTGSEPRKNHTDMSFKSFNSQSNDNSPQSISTTRKPRDNKRKVLFKIIKRKSNFD